MTKTNKNSSGGIAPTKGTASTRGSSPPPHSIGGSAKASSHKQAGAGKTASSSNAASAQPVPDGLSDLSEKLSNMQVGEVKPSSDNESDSSSSSSSRSSSPMTDNDSDAEDSDDDDASSRGYISDNDTEDSSRFDDEWDLCEVDAGEIFIDLIHGDYPQELLLARDSSIVARSRFEQEYDVSLSLGRYDEQLGDDAWHYAPGDLHDLMRDCFDNHRKEVYGMYPLCFGLDNTLVPAAAMAKWFLLNCTQNIPGAPDYVKCLYRRDRGLRALGCEVVRLYESAGEEWYWWRFTPDEAWKDRFPCGTPPVVLRARSGAIVSRRAPYRISKEFSSDSFYMPGCFQCLGQGEYDELVRRGRYARRLSRIAGVEQVEYAFDGNLDEPSELASWLLQSCPPRSDLQYRRNRARDRSPPLYETPVPGAYEDRSERTVYRRRLEMDVITRDPTTAREDLGLEREGASRAHRERSNERGRRNPACERDLPPKTWVLEPRRGRSRTRTGTSNHKSREAREAVDRALADWEKAKIPRSVMSDVEYKPIYYGLGYDDDDKEEDNVDGNVDMSDSPTIEPAPTPVALVPDYTDGDVEMDLFPPPLPPSSFPPPPVFVPPFVPPAPLPHPPPPPPPPAAAMGGGLGGSPYGLPPAHFAIDMDIDVIVCDPTPAAPPPPPPPPPPPTFFAPFGACGGASSASPVSTGPSTLNFSGQAISTNSHSMKDPSLTRSPCPQNPFAQSNVGPSTPNVSGGASFTNSQNPFTQTSTPGASFTNSQNPFTQSPLTQNPFAQSNVGPSTPNVSGGGVSFTNNHSTKDTSRTKTPDTTKDTTKDTTEDTSLSKSSPFTNDPTPPQDPDSTEDSSLMEEKDCSSYYSREEIFKVGTIEEWYKAFIESRALERQELIAAGVIDNPAVQKPLEEAKPFRGTCIYMCPSFESVQRIHQKMVDKFEMTDGKPDHKKFVKSFHRPAAGLEAPLPCDVRKPWILVGTLHYLVKEILGRYPWQECQGFVRDRTRSIRQDFTYQNYEGDEAVHCTEVIIRFHLVGLYLLPDNDEYMELEQLGKSLTTLSFLYKASQVPDADGNYKRFPNEAEFRSYMILTHIHDGYVEREDFMKWPEEVRNSEQVKHAIRIYQAAQKCLRGSAEGFNAMHYANTFFTLVASEKTDFTTACLLEVYFADIRKSALQAIASNYMKTSKMTTLDFIQDLLYYEEIEDLIDEIENYGLEVGQNTIDGVSYTYLVLGGKKFNTNAPKIKTRQHPSLLESKKARQYSGSITHILYGPEDLTTILRPARENKGDDDAMARLATLDGADDIDDEGAFFDFEEASDGEFVDEGYLDVEDDTGHSPSKEPLSSPFSQQQEPQSSTGFNPTAPAFETPKQKSDSDTAKSVERPTSSFSPAHDIKSVFGNLPKSFGSPQSNTDDTSKTSNPFSKEPLSSPFSQQQEPQSSTGFNPTAPAFETPKQKSDSDTAKSVERPTSSFSPAHDIKSVFGNLPKSSPKFGSPQSNTDDTSKTSNPFSIPKAPESAAGPDDTSAKKSENNEADAKANQMEDTLLKEKQMREAIMKQKQERESALLKEKEEAALREQKQREEALLREKERQWREQEERESREKEERKFREERERQEATKRAVLAEMEKKATEFYNHRFAEKNRHLLERIFYRYLKKTRRRMLAKERVQRLLQVSSFADDLQWWPIQKNGAMYKEPVEKVSKQIFESAELQKSVPEIVHMALEVSGMSNTTYRMLLHNNDEITQGQSLYWFQQKFLGGNDKIVVPRNRLKNQFCAQSTIYSDEASEVGFLLFGCSSNFKMSNQQRFDSDRAMLHQIVNHLTQATKFQKLAVMVLCYRSPIDDEQAHPSGLDRARTLGQARRHRIDLVKDALGFSAFNDMVVGKSVVMVETLRDLDLAHELQKFSEDYLLETASPRFAIPTVVKGPEPNRTTRNLSPGSKRKLQEETQQAVKAKRTRVSGPSAPQFSMSSGGSSSESASDTRGTKRKMQTGIESRPAIAPKAPARQIPNGAQQQVKPSMAPQKSAPPVRKTSMSIVEASRRDSPLNRYLAKKAEEESLDEARRRVKTKMELQGFKVTVRSTSDTTTPTKSQPSPAQVDTTPLTEGIKRLEEQLKGLNEYIEANQLPESPCT